MSAHRTSTTRIVRKIEAPRPLKASSFGESRSRSSYSQLLSSYPVDSVEKLFVLMDMVVNNITQVELSSGNSPETTALVTANIIHLCKHLKIYGPQLENSLYQGQLDRAFLAFRDAMVRGCLEYEARAHLLEIIELRECHWIPRKALSPIGNCYSSLSMLQSLQEFDDFVEGNDFKNSSRYYPLDATANITSDEVIKRSGRHRETSSKVSSKNYFKDEILIRNSDSGKVPPTAKERLVQITGPNEENTLYATRLIEDTIRNNSSPIRDLSGSESSSSTEDSADPTGFDEIHNEAMENELLKNVFSSGFSNYPKCLSNATSNRLAPAYMFTHKVIVKNCQLTIMGDDYAYVTVAKHVLDNYFSKLRKSSESQEGETANDDIFFDDSHKNNDDDFEMIEFYSPPPVSRHTNLSLIETFDSPGDNVTTKNLLQDVRSSIQNHLSGLSDYEFEQFGLKTSTPSIPDKLLPANIVTSDSSDTKNSNSVKSVVSETTKENSVLPKIKDNEFKAVYTKELLLECRKSKLCLEKPENWEEISSRFPQIIKITEVARSNEE